MSLQIFPDYSSLSLHVAETIVMHLKQEPESVLCLAAGDTPRLAYTQFVQAVRRERMDISKCTFVGLDEWIGIPPGNEGSCHYFLKNNLFQPLSISPDQVHLFNALTKDVRGECAKMDAVIRDKGGIDFMLVGVGMNGHIGFNEPGVSITHYSHVVDLDETTQSVGQKYFKESTKLLKGITLGLQHLLESRKVIVMASGGKKAGIMQKALEGPVTTAVPASIIRQHPHGFTMLDQDAAALLTTV